MVGYSRTALRAGSLLALIPALLLWTGSASAAGSPPVHYTLDASRSLLRFSFEQAGATNTGRFSKFTTDLLFATDNLPACKLDVTVDVASLDTGDKDRDDTLKGADLFNVAKTPQARFVATKFTDMGGGRYEAAGKLTIRGVTKDVKVPLTFQSRVEQGKTVAFMTGRVPVKRLEYGVGQGEWKSTEWVKDDVSVTFSIRLTPV